MFDLPCHRIASPPVDPTKTFHRRALLKMAAHTTSTACCRPSNLKTFPAEPHYKFIFINQRSQQAKGWHQSPVSWGISTFQIEPIFVAQKTAPGMLPDGPPVHPRY